MVKPKLLALIGAAGLSLATFGAQPASAGVHVNIGVGGYGCGYYGCAYPRYAPYDYGYYRPGYYRPYPRYDGYCRVVDRWVPKWNPYLHRWQKVRISSRTCY